MKYKQIADIQDRSHAHHAFNYSQEINEDQKTRRCHAHLQKQFEWSWTKRATAAIT